MRILGGRRKPPRAQRWRPGRNDEPNPLDGLVTARPVRPSREARKRGKRQVARLTMGHVAFLLAGVALGAGVLVAVPFVAARMHAQKVEEQPKSQPTPAAAAPTPTPAPSRPSRPIVQATTPEQAVRLMLKAAVSGDRETAYAQWEIKPDETATLKAGQALTLAEFVATIQSLRQGLRPENYNYTVRSQSGEEAEVVQKRGQVVTQIFSVHRRGAYWKIRYASSP